MTDSWAAIIVAVVTGLFGVTGILITQWAARKKANTVSVTPSMEVAALMATSQPPAEAEMIAALRMDVKAEAAETRAQHIEVMTGLSDIKGTLLRLSDGQRDGFRSIEDKLDHF